MAFKRAADGIAKKGKTEGKNYGDTGRSVGTQRGGGNGGNPGKRNIDMKTMGRNLAKIAAQKRG